ncbi:thioredoxin family protein [uncultured Nocardioides sp.]|uniref:TlpA family protein disulfide reductase n=1 Tax=uncultured Nocardioides sp. TaxID=198441 RepID=UPI0026153404|nr:thioredoxin family protein [uncultured Nocardioides sp.]
MGTGLTIVVIAVVLALGFGLYRARTDGRFKSAAAEVVEQRGAPATSGRRDHEPAPEVVEQRGAPATSGRRDHSRDHSTAPPTGAAWTAVLEALPEAQLGERATLLQFSSAFCAPCRATRRVLTEVAEVVPGVSHIEVDAEQHLELVRTLGVLRTPTTLVLDAAGRESTRASGAPRKEAVLASLERAVG